MCGLDNKIQKNGQNIQNIEFFLKIREYFFLFHLSDIMERHWCMEVCHFNDSLAAHLDIGAFVELPCSSPLRVYIQFHHHVKIVAIYPNGRFRVPAPSFHNK